MRSSSRAWREGWRRVFAAPALVGGVFALTVVLAVPLALTMRDLLRTHLGSSLMARQAAHHVDYDWWQEFAAQAQGLGTTFTPTILGFAATLDNISSVMDGRAEIAPVASALALYVAGWTFLTGGILDRYARQRPARAYGFFAAGGVFFFRFLRLAIAAGLFYWWMFTYVHPWLFTEQFRDLTRDMSVEREVFAVRVAIYAGFGLLLVLGNMVFDYAKIRAVVEDRRSMLGALNAAVRFVVHRPLRTSGLYALNGAVFLVLLAVWAAAAPGAGGGGASMWIGFAGGQVYVAARLLLKLHFLASQTALFQASLAHAAYTAVPQPLWPDSPAAEALARRHTPS